MSKNVYNSTIAGKNHIFVTLPDGTMRMIINPAKNIENVRIHTNYLILNGTGYKASTQNLSDEERRNHPEADKKLLVYLGKKDPLEIYTPKTVKTIVWKGGNIIEGQSQSYSELQQFLSKVRDESNDYKNISATSGIVMADLWEAKFEGDNAKFLNQKAE